jgi:general secretion pathway protein K
MRRQSKVIKNEDGAALLLTLLILTILVVSGLELTRVMRLEAQLAGNFRDLTQAYYIAYSGVEMARAIIQEDDSSYDSLEEKWGQFGLFAHFSSHLFPEGYFTGTLADEGAKFNPNLMIDSYGNVVQKKKDQMERLLSLLGYRTEVLDAILDWLDPDELKRNEGAEKEYYLSLVNRYPPKNGPLNTPEEMVLIKGLDASFLLGNADREGMGNYLTPFSEGKININTASLAMLMSLSDKIDQSMAQAVINYRQQKPFRKEEDIRTIAGWEAVFPQISSEISVRSNYFAMEIQGYYRDAQVRVQTVIRRDGRRTQILYWKVL